MNIFRKLIPKVKSTKSTQVSSAVAKSQTQEGETAIEARKTPTVISSKVCQHGLFILYPSPDIPNAQLHYSVDIVAVHGLNGKAWGTWTDKDNRMLWLKDFLPEEIPDARIMTFGYDSTLMFSQSKGRIEDFARDLLNRLWMLRQSPQARDFEDYCCMNLGGIVVKKALVLAHELNHQYHNIVTSTIGIVFMGTPHRGADIVNWTSFLTNAIKAVSGNQIVRTDLLKELNTHSLTLLEISKSFLPRSSNLSIMSFIETQIEPSLKALVVPTESSQLGLPNEMVFPVNEHHRSICRYPSATDQTYMLVKASIKSILLNTSGSLPSEDTNAESDEIILRISGLRYKISATNRGFDTCSQILHVSGDTDFGDLGRILEKQAPGQPLLDTCCLIIPQDFKFKGCTYPISHEWIDCFTLPIRVTNGQPCYNSSLGYQINAQQSIAAFFSKIFPDSMEAKIRKSPKLTQDGVKLSHSVMVGKDDASALQISLIRTARIQDRKATKSQVPEELGTFPLFSTQPYKDRLPSQAASQGGLFFPMYEREAMYIAFDCLAGNKYAVRPFLGGINAISGRSLIADHSNSPRKQDYIVIPEQRRLDGISVQPGIVKQFVAVTLNPKSAKDQIAKVSFHNKPIAADPKITKREATIEWQMTGKDEIGGIQLQIIPQFNHKQMFAGSIKDACPRHFGGRLESYRPVPSGAAIYDVLKTPEELGLNAGDTIHIRNFDQERRGDRSKKMFDLRLEMPNSSNVLELEALPGPVPEIIVLVQSSRSGHDAISFRVTIQEKFDAIQMAAQRAFQLRNGILHISGRVHNNPDLHLPVTSWKHLKFLVEPEIWSEKAHWSTDGCYLANFENQHSDTDIEQLRIGPNVDLILLPIVPKRVCRIIFPHNARAESNNTVNPLLLEVPEDATVETLRKMLERVTKASTHVFRVTSLNCSDLPNENRIFDQENIPECYSMPVLAFNSSIRLYIRTLTGKTICIYAWPEDTIENVKLLVQRKEGIPPKQQTLVSFEEGILLKDELTLNDYGIKGTVKIVLVLRLRGGGSPGFTTVTLGGSKILVRKVTDVSQLKADIFRTFGIFVHCQQFDLPDDFFLADKSLTLELKLRPHELVPLGIGAGGNLIQEIIKDKSNPAIWDVGSSKILSIHIINSHDFTTITGKPAPKAPVPRETYLALSLSRGKPLRGKNYNKGKGVSSNGAFDNLIGLDEGEEDDFKDDWGLTLSDTYASDGDDRFPLALLETDQTVPWFRGLGQKK
ncbi:uncharacterized protein TRIVIDRAFT_70307 [Trichoderma virens Gv29-8]|uniref:Ubiquitin-like domain-containing protein n=1 Tax=Hypocrea virens (strain Gv29-8 / FGSC 10586) TaxID=413071 RepID=G9MW42_HYPVG|nr:uncharacterized protein TRIVIDRAFT_70307 [Trichoderma virens Gv29-8]EHK21338.1 hypothetical protein TRIVIDRAFT_70307 [Trichoderma virens Gv29-8]